MKKQILIALSCFWAFTTSAQISMSDALKIMPTSQIPYLTENNILDCLDFKEAGMDAVVNNELNGKSELQALTQRYASFRLNDAAALEMLMLQQGQQQLICVVRTYGTDVRESTIEFYTNAWKSLPVSNYIALPQQMFTAKLDEADSSLTITSQETLNRPASEEQKENKVVQTKLNWNGEMFK